MFSLSLKAQDCFLWISLRVGPIKRNQEGSMPALIRVAQSERKHCTLSIIFFPPHSLIYVEIVSMQHRLNPVCLTLMKKKALSSAEGFNLQTCEQSGCRSCVCVSLHGHGFCALMNVHELPGGFWRRPVQRCSCCWTSALELSPRKPHESSGLHQPATLL